MEWLLDWGYLGLFIGSFLAATIIPFSSDVLLVGMLVAGADPVSSVICASIGNWLGGLTSFGLGWLGKWEWIEKIFKISPEKLSRQKAKVDKYGSGLAFFTWLPGVGDVMAIALGFYKTNPKKTAIFMLLGKSARFIMWAVAYYYIQPYFPDIVKFFKDL